MKKSPRANSDTLAAALKADPKNPNRMTPEDKARMVKALREFGDLGGIVLNRRTGLLVGGHQRVDVLREGRIVQKDLPKPEPDGTVARGHIEHGGRRYTLRVVDWPESKAHAAMIAANRFGRLGQDDQSILAEVLSEVRNTVSDTDLLGFSEDEILDLQSQAEPQLPENKKELRPFRIARVLISYEPEHASIVSTAIKALRGVSGIEVLRGNS